MSKLDQIRAMRERQAKNRDVVVRFAEATARRAFDDALTALPHAVLPHKSSPKKGSSYARVKRWREKHPEEHKAQHRELMRKKRHTEAKGALP